MIIRGQAIIDFLEGKTADYKGRSFDDIINSSDETLEKCHDQIQQIFPLHEISKHAHTYPVVDKDIIEKARKSDIIKVNLVIAKDRFERFYGFEPYFDIEKQSRWCKYKDHNLLRITRIIRCLRLFGLDVKALDFYGKAIAAGTRFGISNVTINYWDKAMSDDVWETLQ